VTEKLHFFVLSTTRAQSQEGGGGVHAEGEEIGRRWSFSWMRPLRRVATGEIKIGKTSCFWQYAKLHLLA